MITLDDTSWYDRGRQAALKFPELNQLDRALGNVREERLKKEERNYQQVMSDKKWFLDMLKTDPVKAITTKGAIEQQTMLDEYNNQAANLYLKNRSGVLSDADKMELVKLKSLLEAKQNKLLVDQERYLKYSDILSNDPNGHYDTAYGKAKLANWALNGGEFPDDALRVRPQNMVAYLRGIKDKVGSSTKREVRKDANGNDYFIDTRVISKDDAQRAITSSMDHEGRLYGVINDFDIWANKPENYKAVSDLLGAYDRDKNDTVDPAERQYAYEHMNPRDNPIIQWAINNPDYLNELMDVKESASKNVPQPSKGGFTIDIFGRTGVKFAPGTKATASLVYGDRSYNEPYQFDGTFKLSNVPTLNGVKLKGRTSTPITSKGNIEGYLKNYDPDKDVFILAATGTDPNIDNGTLVEIPASNFNQVEINKIPIVVDGKQTTLGTIRNRASAPQVIKKKAY